MRKDGKRVKNAEPMYAIVPYILEKRYDAMNMIELDFPVAPMQEYLNRKRKEGYEMSHLGIVIAAYLRAAAEYPMLNRFIMNKRIYARNEFTVGMVVLKPGQGEGTMSKMYFDVSNTIYDVHRIMNEYIEANRQTGDNNATDDIMRKLLAIPGLCNLGVGLFKLLDKYGLLPRKVIEASPFHISLGITNLASIRTNHIYHHVYEFGTTSVFVSMGNLREVPVRKHGEVVFERCIPMGIVMDERNCSGSYFAKVCQRLKQYLANPALLEVPPAVINRDF